MDSIFKKLNYKNHPEVFVINAPDSFASSVESIGDSAKISTSVDEQSVIEFAVVFAKMQQEINDIASNIVPRLSGDAILWVCYPKASSKKYRCDFNRDTGWEVLGKSGLEGVRQVAVDEDWSALRFRKTEYIKKITRRESMAISAEGKKRTTKKGE
ncbi:MAG: hypothetical protein ACOC12_04215 [Bacteroidota bacterium]